MISALSNAAGTSFTPDNSGWLGLALNSGGGSTDFDFMEQLVAAGVATDKKFGLHLENEIGSSHIDIGAFKAASIKTGKSTVDLAVRASRTDWETQLTGIAFGFNDEDTWGFADTYAKFDSGV